MQAILADESHPKTLEEFVSVTTPPRTKEAFDAVIALLEPQRIFIESHLFNFKTSNENWHRLATNLWNSLPTILVRRVNDVFMAGGKVNDGSMAGTSGVKITDVKQSTIAEQDRLDDLEARLAAAEHKLMQAEKRGKKEKEPK